MKSLSRNDAWAGALANLGPVANNAARHLLAAGMILCLNATPSFARTYVPAVFTTLEKGIHGEFRKIVLVVATSADSFRRAMERLVELEALWIVPGRDAPDGVDWGHEAVVLVASGGGNCDVNIQAAGKAGQDLILDVDFPYLGLDIVEYSTYHIVKFETWPGVEDIALAGQEAYEALMRMSPKEVRPPVRQRPGRLGSLAPSTDRPMSVGPNPSWGRVELSLPVPASPELVVLSVNGRRVRTLVAGTTEAGETRWTWDGLAEDGRPVPPGIYYACADTPQGRVVTRLVRLR